MPEGNKIFSAVLMENDTGKISAATVRNYDLKLNVPDASNENMQNQEGQQSPSFFYIVYIPYGNYQFDFCT